jgi:hypothetical protein
MFRLLPSALLGLYVTPLPLSNLGPANVNWAVRAAIPACRYGIYIHAEWSKWKQNTKRILNFVFPRSSNGKGLQNLQKLHLTEYRIQMGATLAGKLGTFVYRKLRLAVSEKTIN